jgi:O-antigen/teichoic acid export membrane protein
MGAGLSAAAMVPTLVDLPAGSSDAARLLGSYGLAAAAIGLLSTVLQGYAALGRFRAPSVVLAITVSLGLGATIPLVKWLGVYGFAVGELAINIAAATALLVFWARRNQGAAAGHARSAG